ncbi:MAG: addiction module protein [Proteobacteria bacterium]|nr:addiction module protein [Pseudomonadota bacterium]
MEELRESISREESRLDSPTWHQVALQEAAARYGAGQEQPLDWATVKCELRKRADRHS